jgi:hypothetical protein
MLWKSGFKIIQLLWRNTMASLEDTVRSVVQDFINAGTLFTALDVSNTVKQTLPSARHREVRDVVRGMFTSDIGSQNWARTPISVNLDDGTTADALLYHPLSDSWDLDNKYDVQKRAQKSFRPVAAAQAVLAGAQASAVVSANLPSVSAPVSIPAPVPMPNARTLWDQMFQTQPSLFPAK